MGLTGQGWRKLESEKNRAAGGAQAGTSTERGWGGRARGPSPCLARHIVLCVKQPDTQTGVQGGQKQGCSGCSQATRPLSPGPSHDAGRQVDHACPLGVRLDIIPAEVCQDECLHRRDEAGSWLSWARCRPQGGGCTPLDRSCAQVCPSMNTCPHPAFRFLTAPSTLAAAGNCGIVRNGPAPPQLAVPAHLHNLRHQHHHRPQPAAQRLPQVLVAIQDLGTGAEHTVGWGRTGQKRAGGCWGSHPGPYISAYSRPGSPSCRR